MTLAKNIRYLRKKMDWSQDFIAEKLGYKSYTTIQKWEMGISEPPLKKLKELADLFHVDMNELANTDMEDSFNNTSTIHGVRIPVLGTIVAGIPIDAIEDILDYEEITPEMASCGEYFGLKVKGSSMEPRICEGDIVIIRQQPDIESGEIAVVMINGNEATLKKVVKQENGITLIGFNTAVYEPHFYTYEEVESLPICIAGKLVELRAKF